MFLPCAVFDMKNPTDIRDPVATASARPDSYDQRRTPFPGILIRPPFVVNDNLANLWPWLNQPSAQHTGLHSYTWSHSPTQVVLSFLSLLSLPRCRVYPRLAVSSRTVSCIPYPLCRRRPHSLRRPWTDPPASTSQALKLQAYTTMHGLFSKRDQTQDLGHFRQSLYQLRYISSPRLISLVPDLLLMPDHRLQVELQAARNQITLYSPCIYWLSSPPPPPVYKTLPTAPL